MWVKSTVFFSLRKEIENINNLCNYYNKLIKNVNVTIEENEEAVTEALKETKTSKDELSALSKVVSFHV